MISVTRFSFSSGNSHLSEHKVRRVILKHILFLLTLLLGVGNLYAQGGEYWSGQGLKPPTAKAWFSSAGEVCDTFLPESGPHPVMYYPIKNYTFINMELLGDEQNRAAYCYMENCYTYYSTYLGREDTLCGTVRYAQANRGFCPDQTNPDFAAKDCFPKFRLVAPTDDPTCSGAAEADPCNPMTGNVLLSETDIPGAHGTAYSRHYQSQGDGQAGSRLGVNWTHNFGARLQSIPTAALLQQLSVASSSLYDSPQSACVYGWRRIKDKAFGGRLSTSSASYENGTCVVGGGKVVLNFTPDQAYPWLENSILTKVLVRPNGGQYTFRKSTAGDWISLQGLTIELTEEGDTWVLIFDDGATERYGPNGYIQLATAADGRQTQYLYDSENQLTEVTHPNGQTTSFEYTDGRISRVVAPGGTADYAYDEIGNLVRVTYPDGSNKQYLYEDPNFPYQLTGVIDEKGVRIATWSYDTRGRVAMNERAEGTEHYTFAYTRYGWSTVNDGVGATRTYYSDVINGKNRFTRVTGDRCDTCGHGDDQQRSYDDQGRILSRTDWNGATTTYVRDDTGLELSRTEAAGTPQARTITTEWHADFRKPVRITEPERVTEYTYDTAGRLLNKTERALP
jgi:YD repeat-containing protein